MHAQQQTPMWLSAHLSVCLSVSKQPHSLGPTLLDGASSVQGDFGLKTES